MCFPWEKRDCNVTAKLYDVNQGIDRLMPLTHARARTRGLTAKVREGQNLLRTRKHTCKWEVGRPTKTVSVVRKGKKRLITLHLLHVHTIKWL